MSEKGELTARRICDVAVELINERGFDNTTVSDICKEAGVSNGAFFHHFKTKNDVLSAYVLAESQELLDFYQYLEQQGIFGEEALRRVIKWQASYYEKKGLDFIAHFHSDQIQSRKCETFSYSLGDVIEKCIMNGQIRGEFRTDVPAKTLALMLYTQILGLSSFSTWDVDENGRESSMKDRLIRMGDDFITLIRGC